MSTPPAPNTSSCPNCTSTQDADQDLGDRVGDHLLDQERVGERREALRGTARLLGRADIEHHAANLALVSQLGGHGLHDDRKAGKPRAASAASRPLTTAERGTGTPKAASALLASCSVSVWPCPSVACAARAVRPGPPCCQQLADRAGEIQCLEGFALALQRDDAGREEHASPALRPGERFRERRDQRGPGSEPPAARCGELADHAGVGAVVGGLRGRTVEHEGDRVEARALHDAEHLALARRVKPDVGVKVEGVRDVHALAEYLAQLRVRVRREGREGEPEVARGIGGHRHVPAGCAEREQPPAA